MARYMAVVDTLSTHSPDEEYLGQRPHPSTWTNDISTWLKHFMNLEKPRSEFQK
ncbi:hypothetical protein QQ045_030450 [Rhodiola kirilowii]